ncbi:MAG: nucleotidyltransferase family protein [Kordiimonadaceae bacterium]|nr:nucleotidyltransferase family protein [Kordiimonadaceae bacterium]
MVDNILIDVLKKPEIMEGLSREQWNTCLREAKMSGLAGRLSYDARDIGIIEKLPAKVQDIFSSYDYNSASSTRKIKWEINRVKRALKGSDEKVVLLKGGAYIEKGMSCTVGRVSVDLDILIARNRIDWAEDIFLKAGWRHQVINDYDQKFYREYSHELPPLVHPDRYISIDVHHNILPTTSKLCPDVTKMIETSVKMENGFYVFSNEDIILHSIVHQFQDGEVRSSLRNLIEQHDMYKEFGKDEGFWQKLIPRAIELGFTRALYYSIHFAKNIFGTAIPDHIIADIKPYGPNIITGAIMKFMVMGVISPNLGAKGIARWASMNGLYIRSHWLRMPPVLLARHLTIKFFRKFQADD